MNIVALDREIQLHNVSLRLENAESFVYDCGDATGLFETDIRQL
ncbi:MAG: hypothetical protein R3C05_23405 [Pirellulaceae bacterium]